MVEKKFSEMMDRSKKDRLEGEVLMFCTEMEKEGYHNIDIAFSLIGAAITRIKREGPVVSENFYIKMKKAAENWINGMSELDEEIGQRVEKERYN